MSRHLPTRAILLATALTLVSAATNANAPHTGFYVGVGVGGAALTGKSNLSLSRNNPALGVTPSIYNTTIGDKNFNGDLFLGYGKRLNCFCLAIEVIARFTSLNSKAFLDVTPTVAGNNGQYLQTRTTNAWGGAINLGYHISQPTHLYLKLGVESRRFRTAFAGSLPVTDPTIVNVNQSKNSFAFVPGLGIETSINTRVSLRGEYQIALHKSKTVQAANSAVDFTTVNTKPTIHYFTLGVKFNI